MSAVASLPRLAINEAVVFAALNDEAVLLHIETGIYFGLDETGARIWTLLSEGYTEEAIIGKLLEEYDVEPALLRSDVTTFLANLLNKGLATMMED